MKLTILKPFAYAADHINVVMVQPGEAEIADDLVPGLVAEGYVGGPGIAAPPPVAAGRPDPAPESDTVPDAAADDPPPGSVEIPDDWRALKWPALRSLASKVSDEPIHNHADAVAAIELELERRAGAGA